MKLLSEPLETRPEGSKSPNSGTGDESRSYSGDVWGLGMMSYKGLGDEAELGNGSELSDDTDSGSG